MMRWLPTLASLTVLVALLGACAQRTPVMPPERWDPTMFCKMFPDDPVCQP